MKNLLVIVLFFGMLYSCNQDSSISTPISNTLPANALKNIEYFSYSTYRPNFQQLITADLGNGTNVNGIGNNPNNPFPIDKVVNLGRVLFYDKTLSVNGQVSCGSCHLQSKAFTDGQAFSQGFNKSFTDKSAMSIQNMGFLNNYMWQSNTDNLVDLVKKPLVHPIEMGNNTIGEVINRIKSVGYYDALHKLAFGNAEIEEKSVTWALAQFVGSIYSASSRFDKSLEDALADFTQEEKQGKELFFGKALCNQCHAFPTFAAPDFAGGTYGKSVTDIKNANSPVDRKGLANNGLPGLIGTLNKMKIPTLRNIEVTGPYMHDGRFKTLDEVIEYYDHQITKSENLDELLRTKDQSAVKLNLSVIEKKALKAFLLTLTDTDMLTAKRYSDPF